MEGGIKVNVDSISYDTCGQEIIIKYSGCEENWYIKYHDLKDEFDEEIKAYVALKEEAGKLQGDLSDADDEIEGFKEDLAEANSKIEDQEVEIEDLQAEIKKLKSELQTLRNI